MDSDRGKLFVGGISWETTEEKLRDYFKAYGEVMEAIIMRDRVTGRARGFGFVVFADPAAADHVLQEKHTIDGRVVEAKKAVPREEHQNFSRANGGNQVSGGQIRTKKIFVGGLAATVTEENFKKHFEQFGNITDVVVMYDHNTQRPRGFGFITFDSEDAVDKVVQKAFHELNDKMVEVKRAVPKELAAGLVAGRAASGGGSGGAGRGTPFISAYGHGYNVSPGSAYSPRPDSRYGPPLGPGRTVYPLYGGYGAAGYGTGGLYGAATMNGGYGPSSYGGVAGYVARGAYGGGYGGTPAGGGYGSVGGYGIGGVPSAGYGNALVGPRSPWSSAVAGTGFTSGGSPAGFGSTNVGAMSGYLGASWSTRGPMQPTVGAGYGSGGYGYWTGETGNSSAAGYGSRAGISGYVDSYSGAGYGDPVLQPGSDSHSSPAAGLGGGLPGAGVRVDGILNGPTSFAGYSVNGRQVQRGFDARFRPYPAAGERAV